MIQGRKHVVGGVALMVFMAASAPALAGFVTVDFLPSNSTIDLGEVLTLDVKIADLDLGGAASLDGVTLNFVTSDPALSLGAFTPGPLLSGWMDVTNRPPFPDKGWSLITFAGGITGTGTLGTIDAWSDTMGTYTLAFDVTSAGVATEFAGGGTTFTLTTVPATVVVPEPASMSLVGAGLLVAAIARRRRPAKGMRRA